MGNKGAKPADAEEAPIEGGGPAPMDNSVSPLPEAPLAMMEMEKTPITTPMHDMPPPPDEK